MKRRGAPAAPELNPGSLRLRWTESGGPPARASSSPGFGTRIITGYGAEEIEPRYTHVPILQKPIEPVALRSIIARQPATPGMGAERRSVAG